MEYVPPSDPEDNDFDAETFDLYRLNEPTQVFTFEHHPRGDTYTNLQAFGQSEIGGDADPDNRAETAETANDNAAHGPPSASPSSESVRRELEENVTAERPNSRAPASPQVAPLVLSPAPEAHLQNSPGPASPQVVPRVVSLARQTQRPNSPEYMHSDDALSSPPSPSSSISDAPDGPGSPNFPDAPPDISDEEESSPPPSPTPV